jgi:hypothetical protein
MWPRPYASVWTPPMARTSRSSRRRSADSSSSG